MEILQIIIPKRMKDQRIDAALSEMIPDYSRSRITAWIKSGEALKINHLFLSILIAIEDCVLAIASGLLFLARRLFG